MKTNQWAFRAFIFACLVQTVSCTKSIDNLPNDSVTLETSSDATGPFEFSNCKLRRIYQSYGEGLATINGLFTYNNAGNPISLVFNGEFGDDHYFFYDKQNRLIEYRISGDQGEWWHYYGYDENNRIIKDTEDVNPTGINHQIFVSTLTYDSQGRIIKENIKNIYNGPDDTSPDPFPLLRDRNPTYTYDNRGNIGVIGWKSSWYDYNKVSIFRAHPIFQFIHRNYSQNNSSVQAKYNSRGLPLAVIPGNDVFFNLKNVTKAVYDCQ
jgi:hypothetical protein